MTKHDLKELAAMGAELGAAKAENDRLRGLLHDAHDTIRNLAEDLDEDEFQATIDQLAEIELALAPQQAEPEEVDYSYHSHEFAKAQTEPTDTFTAVEMATAAAQGFRDGQAAVEQAQAPDWLSSYEAMGDRILAAGWRPETDAQWDGLRRMHAEYAAPFAQTAPLKPHQLRELVNDLRDVARKYHATEQLREQIAYTLRTALSAQGAVDD